MIDLEQELERAVGAPGGIAVDAIRDRVRRRRNRRRGFVAATSAAVLAIVLAGAILATDREEVRTAGPTPAPSTTDGVSTSVPAGWVSVNLTALHDTSAVPDVVTLFVWTEQPDSSVPVDTDDYPRWEALYQGVEILDVSDTDPAGAVEGAPVYQSEVTVAVPPEAAQLIVESDAQAELAITAQPPEGPVVCGPCPHAPDFVPPDVAINPYSSQP